MTTSIPPPATTLRPKTLLKQMTWSPEIDYDDSWHRRKSLSRHRSNRPSLSVTDEDIDELCGFLDLGMVFADGGDCPKRLSEALPALDLYLEVRRAFRGSNDGGDSSSSELSPAKSSLSILEISPRESQEARQAGIKRWARLVALAARDCR